MRKNGKPLSTCEALKDIIIKIPAIVKENSSQRTDRALYREEFVKPLWVWYDEKQKGDKTD